MFSNKKCSAADWCVALATPNTTLCRLHLKYPLLHSFESQNDWLVRVRKEMKKAAKAAEEALASDRKMQRRVAGR